MLAHAFIIEGKLSVAMRTNILLDFKNIEREKEQARVFQVYLCVFSV